MPDKISRRSFMKQTATSVIAGSILPSVLKAGNPIIISVAQGKDYYQNTVQAVQNLGGIEEFIPKNARVAILANPQRNNPGAFTCPEVLRAAIDLIKTVRPNQITCLSWLPLKNWENTGLKKVVEKAGIDLNITDLKNEELFKPVAVPAGKELREARIMRTFFEYDTFINIPITKDHAGNKFTGTMKNLMGLNSPKNNRTFHKPDWDTNPDSIAFMDQCIADLNTIIQPDLCIVDATEFITTNGPFGPGKIITPKKVVAGTDRVAIDAYCSTLWGLNPQDIFMIRYAHQHGLGESDLDAIKIKEIKV